MSSNCVILILLSFTLSIISISSQNKCTESNSFKEITSNSLNYVSISKDNVMCFKYKLKPQKQYILINFKIANTYTGEVAIYKSLSDISNQNTFETYSIYDHQFNEINLETFNDYVFIIIKDKSRYYFNDYFLLYDSEETIEMHNGEIINIKKFMPNLEYNFHFHTNNKFELYFNSKTNGNKNILINGASVEDNGIHIKYDDLKELSIKVKQLNENEDQEFSLVIYENNGMLNNDAELIKKNEIINKNYIYYNYDKESLNFYFYADISDYKNSATVNLKFDYTVYNNKYISVYSDIVNSESKLDNTSFSDNFKNIENNENNANLPRNYDINSDEYYKIYFKGSDKKNFTYIIILVKVSNYNNYFSNKSFSISITEELNVINNSNNLNYYNAYHYNHSAIDYIPSYLKFNLEKNANYLFYCPYQENLLLVNGDLLSDQNGINQNYLNFTYQNFYIASNISELTFRLFGYKLNNASYIIEKYSENDVKIVENKIRNLTISMNENDCTSGNKKYILNLYRNEIYSTAKQLIYITTDLESEFNFYYKNTTILDNQSFFPSSDNYLNNIETLINLSNDMNFFTIKCKKPGNLYIWQLENVFDEKTHLITQNSIHYISINNGKTEILQFTFDDINYLNELIYIEIYNKDNEIAISSDDEAKVLNNTIIIKANELFTINIDKNKLQSFKELNQFAIKVTSNKNTNIEVTEVVHKKYTKKINIYENKTNNIKENNFVIFINKNISAINVNISGLKNNESVFYGIVELSNNNTNYLLPAYKFKNNIANKLVENNEKLKIKNNYGNFDDKKYYAFIFSVYSSETNKNYNVDYSFDEEKISKKDNNSNNNLKIILLIAGVSLVFIIVIIIIIIVICQKKNKNTQIDDISTSLVLYPNNEAQENTNALTKE